MTAHADGGLQAASGNPGGRQGFATDRREAEFFGRSRGGQPAIRQESARTELPMFNVHWLQQSFDTTRGRRHGQVGRRLVPERLRPHRSSRYCTARRLTGESRAILLSLMVSTTTAAATIRVGGGLSVLPSHTSFPPPAINLGLDRTIFPHLTSTWPAVDPTEAVHAGASSFLQNGWFSSPSCNIDTRGLRALSPSPDSSSCTHTLAGVELEASALSEGAAGSGSLVPWSQHHGRIASFPASASTDSEDALYPGSLGSPRKRGRPRRARGERPSLVCGHPEGCSKTAYFGAEGASGGEQLFCKQHKDATHTNVVSRRCEQVGCAKRPVFGNRAEGPRFCSSHRLPGHVDLANKRCRAAGCAKHPVFGPAPGGCAPGAGDALFCAEHKAPEHVNVRHRRCGAQACTKFASFAPPGQRVPRTCHAHKSPGDVYAIARGSSRTSASPSSGSRSSTLVSSDHHSPSFSSNSPSLSLLYPSLPSPSSFSLSAQP